MSTNARLFAAALVLLAACAHLPPRDELAGACASLLPPVTAVIDETGLIGPRYLVCGDAARDRNGRVSKLDEAERTCRADGCMWWSLRRGDAAAHPGTLEVCGEGRVSDSHPRPVYAFRRCYWLTLEKQGNEWRVGGMVAWSTT